MADLSVTPVGANVKPVQGMSLGEMINFARGAQQYRAEKEILPEQISQAKLATTKQEQDLAQSRFKAIADSQIALINDPLVLMAEENPDTVDKTQLVNLLQKRGMTLGKNLGLPENKVTELLAPYLEQAEKDPGQLRTFLKQRHIRGLDEAGRTAVLTGTLTPVQTGAGTTFIQSGEFAGERRGAPVLFARKTLAPGEQIVAGPTDPAGNPTYNILDRTGRVIQSGLLASQLPEVPTEVEPVGAAVERVPPPSVQTVSAPKKMPERGAIAAPPGSGLGPNDYSTLQQQVTVARGSLGSAENALKQVDNVETYLDRAIVGVGSEKVNKALSALGWVKLSEAEKKAAAREIVKKSLAALTIHQNATNNGKLAADLQQANDASANPELTDPAIRKVVSDIKVMMQHQKNYTLGLDKLISKYPQHGAFNKALYDTAMNDVYDIEAIELNNLLQDKKLTNAQKKEKGQELLDKYGVDQFSELNSKAKLYNNLINGNVQIVDGKLVPITGK